LPYDIDILGGFTNSSTRPRDLLYNVYDLEFEACIKAASGELDDAVKSIAASLAIGRSLARKPQLVRINTDKSAARACQNLLSRHQSSESLSRRLISVWEQADRPTALREAFIGETLPYEAEAIDGRMRLSIAFNTRSGVTRLMISCDGICSIFSRESKSAG
jgi:hypothetical protein